jgi:hypothetical protein
MSVEVLFAHTHDVTHVFLNCCVCAFAYVFQSYDRTCSIHTDCLADANRSKTILL